MSQDSYIQYKRAGGFCTNSQSVAGSITNLLDDFRYSSIRQHPESCMMTCFPRQGYRLIGPGALFCGRYVGVVPERDKVASTENPTSKTRVLYSLDLILLIPGTYR